jgi:hypothetical protein
MGDQDFNLTFNFFFQASLFPTWIRIGAGRFFNLIEVNIKYICIYSIAVGSWNVASYKWKVHNGNLKSGYKADLSVYVPVVSCISS